MSGTIMKSHTSSGKTVLQQVETIRFRRNWNNKLGCDFFTTIRLNSPKYQRGNILRVILEERGVLRTICDARVVEVRPLRIHQLNDWMCWLDSATDAPGAKELLWEMYRDRMVDIHTAELVYVLLEKLKIKPVQQSLFG